ncbi:MAG: asparagine synthetase B, partial [Candidatus Omnitrophota bacterium]
MCGICGKLTIQTQSNIDEALIKRMCATLVHRGPDDEGIYVGKGSGAGAGARAGLGHRRLSIIDLSAAGHQPMANEDRTLWIVLNGEIYNFQELRCELKLRGHRFVSGSDTEVVLHLYEEAGDACVTQLRGMFAFAIWDEKRGRLFAARDRVGKKPFYYYQKNGTFIFGSEIKAILQDPTVSAQVNRSAITDYLTYGYTPAPLSMFTDINKLEPAHTLVWEKGEVAIRRYW